MFKHHDRVLLLNAAAVCEPILLLRKRRQHLMQHFQKHPRIRPNLDIGSECGLFKLRLIDINHDLHCVTGNGLVCIAADADAHSGTEHNEQVAILHYEVRRTLPQYPRPPEEERMI